MFDITKGQAFFGRTNIRTIGKALGQALCVYQNKIPNVSTALHFCLRFIFLTAIYKKLVCKIDGILEKKIYSFFSLIDPAFS